MPFARRQAGAEPATGRAWLPGIALLSAGALLLEIALTRVLSVSYFYAHVYVLLSVAVLGLGLGAAAAAARPAWRTPERLPGWASWSALAALLLTLAATSGLGALLPPAPFFFALTPYFFTGLALSGAFATFSRRSPRLYAADLAGAGLGALSAVPLLAALGGVGGMLAAAALTGLAGLLLSEGRRVGWPSAAFVLATAALLVHLSLGWPALDLSRLAAPKPASEQLAAGARVLATRWNAFARSDLLYRPDQDATYLYLDGAAGSLVPAAGKQDRWRRDIGSFAFESASPESVLIIGPGGGLDVALARAAGVPDIVAVELDRAGIEMVRELGAYTGNVYGPGVSLLFDEGRSALSRMDRSFDLVFLSQVVTQTAGARGYALSENGLYTVGAMRDYLDHLNPSGQVAIKLYDELTLTRALTTALAALKRQGLSDALAARHLVALLDARANPPVPLLLIRKEPVEPADAVRMARTAQRLEVVPLFLPGLVARPPLDGLLQGRTSLEDIIASSADADIRPPTDAWPFFYEFQPGLPGQLRPLVWGLAAVLALGLALLIWTARRRRHSLPWSSPLLFGALGFGFMATEIDLLHQTQLFLGHPTLALSVVLGTLLVGGGLGSALLGRLRPGAEPGAIFASGLLVAVCLALWSAAWPQASLAFGSHGPAGRALIAAGSLLPLALFMGMPFPLALRMEGRIGGREVALSWAVNGVMSVAGGVGATVLAVSYGYDSVLAASLAAYLLVAAGGLAAAPRSRGLLGPNRQHLDDLGAE